MLLLLNVCLLNVLLVQCYKDEDFVSGLRSAETKTGNGLFSSDDRDLTFESLFPTHGRKARGADCHCGEGTQHCEYFGRSKVCKCKYNNIVINGNCEDCKCINAIYSGERNICMCRDGFEVPGMKCTNPLYCDFPNGAKNCTCKEGTVEINGACVECNCGDDGHSCEVINGSISCVCKENFIYHNGTCRECKCKESQICRVKHGVVTCIEDGEIYKETCQEDNCVQGECEDDGHSVYCRCEEGYTGERCEIQEMKYSINETLQGPVATNGAIYYGITAVALFLMIFGAACIIKRRRRYSRYSSRALYSISHDDMVVINPVSPNEETPIT